jgi:uncharacterized integral membrane protein (TIGR00698 family)
VTPRTGPSAGERTGGPAGVVRSHGPGVLAAVVVAVVAILLARVVPLLGAPVLALLLGVVLASAGVSSARLSPGLRWTGSRVLQAAIVLLGLTLGLEQVREVGLRALPVVVVAVLVALVAAEVLGRAMGVGSDLRLLIGAGTAICGASAIAAAAGALRARPADVSYALSTVVLFNLVAVLTFPPLGRLLGLDDRMFGVWVGAAVNDTSAVVATAAAWGGGAVAAAVVVKLVRVLAMVPVTAVLARRARRASDEDGTDGATGAVRRPWQVVPGFLVLFVVAAVLGVAGLVPEQVRAVAEVSVDVLVTVALAAVGLATRLRDVARTGPAPLLLGGLVWLMAAGTALGLVLLLG